MFEAILILGLVVIVDCNLILGEIGWNMLVLILDMVDMALIGEGPKKPKREQTNVNFCLTWTWLIWLTWTW